MNSRNFNNIVRRIYSRLLRESYEGTAEGLAAYVQRHGGYAVAVVYRPAILLNSLKRDPGLTQAHDDSVMAFVQVFQPKNPCAGAWEVKIAAGIGYGKILYGVAYALSPEGILMSDRKSVSAKAYKAWSGLQKSGRRSIPLDDAEEDDPKKKKTPTDVSDDCNVHKIGDKDCGGRDPAALNYAYESEGWEKGMLEKMESSHKMFMKVLTKMGLDEETIYKNLKESGMKLFSAQYLT